MKPHVRNIKREQERTEEKRFQDQDIKQHGLARLTGSMTPTFPFPLVRFHPANPPLRVSAQHFFNS
jgi:hypothetical protein